jgi:chlorophyll a/b binding light-harvesting protein PcbD
MGGHAVLAFILTIGGVWHIISSPFGPFKKILIYSGEAILSYSLAGIALMGFVTSIWCAQNTTIYPVEFYGEALKLNFAFSPYFSDTVSVLNNGHTARAWLANTHFYLAFFLLAGSLLACLEKYGL